MKIQTHVLLIALSFVLPSFALADAKDLWTQNCARCHGTDGAGQTKIGKKLGLPDYTDAAVQAKLKDADMLKAVLQGVTVDGKQKMPAYQGKLSADDAKALVAYVRSFKK
ncbi:MAG: cytochrome c [Opitutaceae bacterium]|jgi:mono/diheme cytochrome c family protein